MTDPDPSSSNDPRTKGRGAMVVESGVEDLLILKSTGSGFEKFLRDKFTTLPETRDRIFATKLKATWTFTRNPKSFAAANTKILNAMLEAFAENFSPSVYARNPTVGSMRC